MRLEEALKTYPEFRIFRVDNSESDEKGEWDAQPIDAAVLSEEDGFFIVKAKNILPDGAVRDCYIDISLPERVSDYAYRIRDGSLEVKYRHEFEGELVCAVPIIAFGVYELFYSKARPDIGIEILKNGLKSSPQKAAIAEDLGYILRDERRFDEAAQAFELAVQEGPSSYFISHATNTHHSRVCHTCICADADFRQIQAGAFPAVHGWAKIGRRSCSDHCAVDRAESGVSGFRTGRGHSLFRSISFGNHTSIARTWHTRLAERQRSVFRICSLAVGSATDIRHVPFNICSSWQPGHFHSETRQSHSVRSRLSGVTGRFERDPCAGHLFLCDAVEILSAAQEQFFADSGWRSIEFVVEFVGGEFFEFVGLFENDSDAVSAGQIDFSGSTKGRSIDAGEIVNGFGIDEDISGFGIQAGDSAVIDRIKVKFAIV